MAGTEDPDVLIASSKNKTEPTTEDQDTKLKEPKSISVNMKITDELRKKILESAKSNSSKEFSVNIPLQDLANSTCNSTNCEGVVDAATKAVTGEISAPASNEEALNMT